MTYISASSSYQTESESFNYGEKVKNYSHWSILLYSFDVRFFHYHRLFFVIDFQFGELLQKT